MKSILEDLYNGEITPLDDQPTVKITQPHENLDDQLLEALGSNIELYDKLIEGYDQSARKITPS